MENQMFNDKAQNDALIVEQVQKGNSQAYNLLVIKYQHKIRDVALKFTNNQADASDIAQEAFEVYGINPEIYRNDPETEKQISRPFCCLCFSGE